MNSLDVLIGRTVPTCTEVPDTLFSYRIKILVTDIYIHYSSLELKFPLTQPDTSLLNSKVSISYWNSSSLILRPIGKWSLYNHAVKNDNGKTVDSYDANKQK